jgi:hypothetical protein
MTAREFLAAHSPAPVPAVGPGLLEARASLAAATRDLVAIPGDALERGWQWGDDLADVRYGVYRAIETVELAAAEIAQILDASGDRRTRAAARIAPTTTARWALHGRLAGLDDSWLDRHPTDGEWTAREVLGHVVSGQRGYAALTAWWWARPLDAPPIERIPEDVIAAAALPEEDEEGEGSLDEIRSRLDDVVDEGAAHLANVADEELDRPARWSGMPVDVGFRLGRWSSHIVEHTVQLDKTLTWLAHEPTEAERIVRELYLAWGRLEALIFPASPAASSAVDGRGRSIADVLADAGGILVEDARSARAAGSDSPEARV